MPFDIGQALQGVLDKGLDVWVDSEKAKNFRPGAQTLGQRDAMGTTGQAGQPAANVAPATWMQNPAVWIAVGVGVLVLVVIAVKD